VGGRLLESIRTWRRPEEARYRNLPGKPGTKEGLEPYQDHIRMLDMCYVRDLDKVLLAFHGPKVHMLHSIRLWHRACGRVACVCGVCGRLISLARERRRRKRKRRCRTPTKTSSSSGR
jgi:hypothetical protein